jgi:dolichol kinase
MTLEVAIICFWFLFLSVQQRLFDLLIRRQLLAPFTARKLTHLAVGFWVLLLDLFVRHWYLVAIPITMILAANVQANIQRGNLGNFAKRIFPLIGFLAPLALILSFWHQQRREIVVLAVLAMTVGDTAAAIVGRRFGKIKVSWTGKTMEGALANFAASLLILVCAGFALYDLTWKLFLIPAGSAAAVELVVGGEWDNPTSVLLLMLLLRYPLLA